MTAGRAESLPAAVVDNSIMKCAAVSTGISGCAYFLFDLLNLTCVARVAIWRERIML
jgi:hypothetical protein